MKSFHLVGVCGTAMASLAVMLKSCGHHVTGSDVNVYPPMSDLLRKHGIPSNVGYAADNVAPGTDLVIIGNAVSRGNPEVEYVLDRKMRYASLPEVIRNEFLWERCSLVVTGTHGKTTTASILAWILTCGGIDPSFLIGGISQNLATSGRMGTGSTFVIEGDEYDSAFFDKTAKFLKYLPEVAVVNNIEFDHADIYSDIEELRVSFRRFVRLIPGNGRLIVSADSEETVALIKEINLLCSIETFGIEDSADWRAQDIQYRETDTLFDVVYGGEVVASVKLPLLGQFNVRNALAAIAAAAAVDVTPEQSSRAVENFLGVKRRLEVRGKVRNVTVYDDFAHHPTAVRETLRALKIAKTGGRLWALFEPRSATSCRRVFQKEFSLALENADEVLVAAVQRNDIPYDERLSEEELVDELKLAGVSARYEPTIEGIVGKVAAEAKSGDHVVVMSNGDFGGIHKRLLAALSVSRDR